MTVAGGQASKASMLMWGAGGFFLTLGVFIIPLVLLGCGSTTERVTCDLSENGAPTDQLETPTPEATQTPAPESLRCFPEASGIKPWIGFESASFASDIFAVRVTAYRKVTLFNTAMTSETDLNLQGYLTQGDSSCVASGGFSVTVISGSAGELPSGVHEVQFGIHPKDTFESGPAVLHLSLFQQLAMGVDYIDEISIDVELLK